MTYGGFSVLSSHKNRIGLEDQTHVELRPLELDRRCLPSRRYPKGKDAYFENTVIKSELYVVSSH